MTTNNAPDRTAHDYAIEHAEYMAQAAETLDSAMNQLHEAEEGLLDLTEEVATAEQFALAESAVEKAQEDVSAARAGVRSCIYEFRKRRDRAFGQLAMPADADMFWDADNPECNQDSINNTIVEISQNRVLHVGDIVEIQRAISLPNISVRITSVEDDSGDGELEYEIVDGDRRRIEEES